MYGGCAHRSPKEICRKYCPLTMESENFCEEHVSLDKRTKNEKFMLLRSVVPYISELIYSTVTTENYLIILFSNKKINSCLCRLTKHQFSMTQLNT